MAKKLILQGRVQGVFCRDYCRQNARRIGIRGAASNLPDGTVQVLLDCDDSEMVERYVGAIKHNSFDFRFYGYITNVLIHDYNGRIRGDYVF